MFFPALGSLERIDIRDVWRNEATDFTTWLARTENMAQLSDSLDMDLEIDGTEVPIGPYRADIVATDPQTNTKVIIENQLEKTNHDHLGKVITYAAGLDACCVVWIAREFTEEHRKAIDFLNEKSMADMLFFGVEIQIYKIGNSLPAPFFRVVARPNTYAAASKDLIASEPSERKVLYYDFWSSLKEYCSSHKSNLKLRSPWHRHWYPIAVGKSHLNINLTISVQNQRIGCEIYIRGKNAKTYFKQLQDEKTVIESITGVLEWQELPSKQDCRIVMYRYDVDIREKNTWDEAFAWLQMQADLFQKAFLPQIKKLTIDDDQTFADE